MYEEEIVLRHLVFGVVTACADASGVRPVAIKTDMVRRKIVRFETSPARHILDMLKNNQKN